MNKQSIYYCYSAKLFHYLKEKGHECFFIGFATNGDKVAIFHVTDRLSNDLKRYTELKNEQMGWN
ncbi:hypothetical protein HP456_00075 [Bacillus haikouensis]|uniref:hypothetical protein n=1 Tax=Bacillus haikouensis TaxID=1510468 RepID=UPI0015561EC1|nr:hypothetical protein [Bacillus haikouensis]NQD64318.1 hypothetical protein [Bacillus haikouensis]